MLTIQMPTARQNNLSHREITIRADGEVVETLDVPYHINEVATNTPDATSIQISITSITNDGGTGLKLYREFELGDHMQFPPESGNFTIRDDSVKEVELVTQDFTYGDED